jgi:hypothetical protein
MSGKMRTYGSPTHDYTLTNELFYLEELLGLGVGDSTWRVAKFGEQM